jgi:hypothetical protein
MTVIFMRVLTGTTLAFVSMSVLPIAGAEPDTSDYVRTQSGKVRCIVTSNNVGHGGGPAVICEASGPGNQGFLQAPMGDYGRHWGNAVVDGGGRLSWADANIGGAYIENDTVLRYGQTYRMHGWTIVPSSDGTRFTNDATGHGMFVSIENVGTF